MSEININELVEMKPTMNLRYVMRYISDANRHLFSTGTISIVMIQQEFIHELTGQREWRDVPIVDGE